MFGFDDKPAIDLWGGLADDELDREGGAGTVGGTTDPRLTYTDKARGEAKGLDDKKLPYGGKGWGGREILSNLTQVDDNEETKSDEVRCGANAALAMAIMKGPGGIDKMVDNLDQAALKAMYKSGDISPERRKALEEAYIAAGVAAFRIQEGMGTYGDLSRIADAMKTIMTANPSGQTTGHEAMAMAALNGPTEAKGTPMQDPDHLEQYANQLGKGESYIVHVDTDTFDGKRPLSDKMVNHFITVGKDASGKTYVYDPYPREGSQLTDFDDPLFSNADGDSKAVYLTSKTAR